jgi:sugar/nucleoside kinase (ribokinase family)
VALDTVATPFGEVKEVLGGSAVYFSIAASFFAEVKLVGVVGEDFPQEHVNFLESRNIDLRGLEKAPGKTFRWKGSYDYDLNEAHTLDTQLNVFQEFKPKIPPEYRDCPFVFLGNIDPDLQREVLEQVKAPMVVACDTMNFWIEGKPSSLLETLKKIDILIINDAETRQLAKEPNLVKASRKILSWGPKSLIVKRGEYGALMFSDSTCFAAPALPLEEIYDPTGAGDSFAGGFMGYLANVGVVNEAHIRKAIIFGSVMASFNVEDFSLKRLESLTYKEIEQRYRAFKELAHFEDI